MSGQIMYRTVRIPNRSLVNFWFLSNFGLLSRYDDVNAKAESFSFFTFVASSLRFQLLLLGNRTTGAR